MKKEKKKKGRGKEGHRGGGKERELQNNALEEPLRSGIGGKP